MIYHSPFFVGVVEDVDDPKKLGRVRVRIYGIHDHRKALIPTESLQWAEVMTPVTSAGVSGIGAGPTGLVEGSHVVGIFRDGNQFQRMLVLGSYFGEPDTENKKSEGFNDPNGVYPKYINESDVHRLARNENTEDTYLTPRESSRKLSISLAGTGTWNEPKSDYNAAYPLNHVNETRAGHIFEVDDTTNSERIHTRHKSGSFNEFYPNGDFVQKTVGNDYSLLDKSSYNYVALNYYVTVDGYSSQNYIGGMRVDSGVDYQVVVENEYNLQAKIANHNVESEVTFKTPKVRMSAQLHADNAFFNSVSTNDLRVSNVIQGVAQGALVANALGGVSAPGGDSGAEIEISAEELAQNLATVQSTVTADGAVTIEPKDKGQAPAPVDGGMAMLKDNGKTVPCYSDGTNWKSLIDDSVVV